MSRRKGTLCWGDESHDGKTLVASAVLAVAAVVRVPVEGIVAQWIDFGRDEDRPRTATTLLDTKVRGHKDATL